MSIFDFFAKKNLGLGEDAPLNLRKDKAIALSDAKVPDKKDWMSPEKAIKTCLLNENGLSILIDKRTQLRNIKEDWAKAAEAEISKTLKLLFSRPFLKAESISWSAPAALLEEIMHSEAVHEMESWADLKNRLDEDRRLFSLFHVLLPHKPLAFVEVALTKKIATNIEPILDQTAIREDPRKAECAIFYSITNARDDLRGISFGETLLHEAIHLLNRELPNIKTFCTLSPVPSLRKILESSDDFWIKADTRAIKKWEERTGKVFSRETLLSDLASPSLGKETKEMLRHLTAKYLIECPGGNPKDPVAKFHLGNGARLENINIDGNSGKKGQKESFGIMVNYLYAISELAKNKEQKKTGEAAHSRVIRKILRGF